MKSKAGDNRAFAAVCLLGFVFALVLIWRGNMPSGNTSERGNADQESVSEMPDVWFASGSTESAPSIVAPEKSSTSAGNSPFTPQFTETEQAELVQAENTVFQVVKNIERENVSEAIDKVLANGRVLALAISPPSVEQVGQVSAAIGKELSTFESRPELEKEARKRLERIYWGALMFRKKHRAVYISTDSSEKLSILEVNSDVADPVPPRENGSFRFDFPTITVTFDSDDPEPNSEQTSWNQRYGHLVEKYDHKLRFSPR